MGLCCWRKKHGLNLNSPVNDKEFRQHLAELLARQRNPDQPAKKTPPTPESTPKPATMSNKEFRRHFKHLMARQRSEEPPVEKKPPKSATLEANCRRRKEAAYDGNPKIQRAPKSEVSDPFTLGFGS